MTSGLHRLYVLATFTIVFLLLGGGTAVLADVSVASRLGGALAFLCGAALSWLAVLHLRRPVKR